MSQFGVELGLQTIPDAKVADVPFRVSHMVLEAVAVEQLEGPERERLERLERLELELEGPRTYY